MVSAVNQSFDLDIEAYDSLTRDELYEILRLRNRVFVAQQEITDEPDVDGRDPACHHALMWRLVDDDSQLVGTARLFMDETPVVIGRVAVHPGFQRQGIGTRLMEGIQAFLGSRPAELHAQAYLEDWYSRLGWERRGEPFMEAGLEHVLMQRPSVDDQS